MSKIDDLIAKMCPDGVPLIKLGDLEDQGIIKLGRGDVISKTDLRDTPGEYPVYSSSAASDGLFGKYGQFMFDEEKITWSIDGGGKFFYRKKHKFSVTNVCGWMKVLKSESVSTRYLYYVLISIWGGRTYNYTVKAHPSVIREDYFIPLPPIEIQKEIVAILDKFTELEAELEAELDARKHQYLHFSESLFIFKKGETKRLTVRDICGISRGTVISKDYLRDHPGEYPVYSSQTLNNGIFGFIDTFAYNFESLTWTTDGANAGSIFYHQNEKFTITNVCGLLQVLDPSIISARYLYYLLKIEAPKHVSPGMGNPKIMAGTMGDIQLDIPTFKRQLEIVEILDKFDSLLNDITTGLPAEIKARHQQYEYYRNKLLTFKELDVA